MEEFLGEHFSRSLLYLGVQRLDPSAGGVVFRLCGRNADLICLSALASELLAT